MLPHNLTVIDKLPGCESVSSSVSHDFFFCLYLYLDTTISVTYHVNNRVKQSEWLPGETVSKCAELSPYLNDIISPSS